MYVPRHFAMPDTQALELLAAAESAQLVTAHPDGPVATLLPVLYEPDAAGLGSLHMHVTRTNSQWKDARLGEALAIVSGPDAYVAPEWLASFADAAGVPTWNYVTVHAWGELIVHDDPAWCADAVARVSARHGYDVAQVSESTMDLLLRAIVGLELRVTRLQAKAKLSQNKTPADIAGIIAGLRTAGAEALASDMERIALPHAVARADLIAGIRAGRMLGEVRPR